LGENIGRKYWEKNIGRKILGEKKHKDKFVYIIIVKTL
jgi:hypothetical protein